MNPQPPEMISRHRSRIGGFTVTGLEYWTTSGNSCCDLTIVRSDGSFYRYWLANEEFHAVSTYIPDQRTVEGVTFDIREVVVPPAKVKDAIAKALHGWANATTKSE
jgi:hypothetical protein